MNSSKWTLSELNSLDDARNDPNEYHRLITELRKRLTKERDHNYTEDDEDIEKKRTIYEEMQQKKKKAEETAICNELDNRWGWAGLPQMVISQFLDMLNFKERYNASCVCKNWYWAFHCPRIWREIALKETSFVHENIITIRSDSGMGSCVKRTVKTSPHKGWLNSVGEYIKSVRLYPMEDYNIMSEHCSIIQRLIQICRKDLGYYPLPRLKHFAFTFNPPKLESSTVGAYFTGTGGNIMVDIVAMASSFLGLEDVSINDLLLETNEEVLDLILGLVDCCGRSLKRLQILNLTRDPSSVSVFLFSHLHTLIVSPPQITSEMVSNFGQSDSLRKVHIVQDKFSTPGPEVDGTLWQDVRLKNPSLRVRLHLKDDLKEELLFPPHAPVAEIIYESKFSRVTSQAVCLIIDNYSKTLTTYASLRLPRFHSKKSFHERVDSNLVLLARNCPNLTTLVIRDRVSTATLLLLASRSKHVTSLIVRRNAVIKRADWPKNVSWTDVWYGWLKYSARSYDRTVNDIRDIARKPGWNLLSDFEFAILEVARICDESCGLSAPNAMCSNKG